MKEYFEGDNGWIFDLAILVLLAVFIATAFIVVGRYCDRSEKAAYLEGRYDLDHATAWQLAGEQQLRSNHEQH